ncbi:hypothetical protein SAMN06296241_1389 [Salinimicrobium sediminis]|uniref:HNH endonuclease n=1 Tax=Salinimicrobium sediminis TaxID=1343891 RepID=A0A285X3B7_9FLAO|nr:hypothetical protein [Salinimicrobium sediminis]SOC79851.1 hypothetical protein SAMN06296241_1389 [Salinimicrobium sediminis]
MKDLTSNKFGRLTVKSFAGRNKRYDSLWNCTCDCGNEKVVRGGVLKNGHTQSCGCLQKERTSAAKTTHGLRSKNLKLYKVWGGMKERCYNTNSKSYPDYGARGIEVCPEWKNNYENFYHWAISKGYAEGLTIERRDPDQNYCPENCEWIPKSEQSKNRTTSVTIELNGVTRTATEWSEKLGISSRVITQRIRRGWAPKEALSTKNL